jgi:ribosomal protein S12 methylthiotransferase
VEEARGLEAQGAKELVLVAQDSTQYGNDLRPRSSLEALVRRLLRETGFPWVRVMYLYPETFPSGLLDLMRAEPRLLPYFDLPFQHAAPPVLRRMRRGGSPAHFLRLIGRIRKALPHAVFRSSFIVGYPGETEADVRVLARFLKDARLDRAGFFLYSDEPEAASSALTGKVPKAEAKARLRRLAAVQKGVSLARHRALAGRTLPVLVESDAPFRGRLASMAPEVDGHVALAGAPAGPGALGTATITAAHPYHLKGRWHGTD